MALNSSQQTQLTLVTHTDTKIFSLHFLIRMLLIVLVSKIVTHKHFLRMLTNFILSS